jgi:hypothetical protein
MIPVRETKPGVFERITGNPVLLSRDGRRKAPLRTILALSWTAEERAKFGVYLAVPCTVPDGKIAVGSPRFEHQGSKLVELRELQEAPAPEPSRDVLAELDALAARVSALERR